MAVDAFTNLASTTVSSGGTTAPAAGTVETWVVASGATFPVADSGATPPTQFHIAEDDQVRQSEVLLVTDVALGTLTSALASGTAYTTLSVSALSSAVASGDTLRIGSGTTTQTVVTSAAAASGATSISVTSFTANAAYATGTPVKDLTTPGNGTTWLVTRGAESTTPVTHPSGFTIVQTVTAAVLRGLVVTGGGSTIVSSTAATKGLVVQGAPSQTASLQEWQNSAGTPLASVAASGQFRSLVQGTGISTGGTTDVKFDSPGAGGAFSWIASDSRLVIGTGGPDKTRLQLVANAGQTADLQQWQNSSGGGLAAVDSGGGIFANAVYAGVRATYGAVSSINTVATTTRGLVVRGVASQTANLQEWQDSSGTVLAFVGPAGQFATASTVTAGPGGNDGSVQLFSTASSATQRPLVVRSAASQTANLAEFQDSTGAVLSRITSSGQAVLASFTVNGGDTNVAGFVGANAAAVRPLVVRGAAAQTANLAEFQNSAGTALSGVNSSGAIFANSNGYAWAVNGQATAASAVGVFANTTVANSVPLVVRGAAGQTSNLQEWQSSTGSAVLSIDPNGIIQHGLSTSGDLRIYNSANAGLRLYSATPGSATQYAKSVRVGGTGNLEFINSAYNSVITSMTDTGAWTAPSFTSTSTRASKSNVATLSVTSERLGAQHRALGQKEAVDSLVQRFRLARPVSYTPKSHLSYPGPLHEAHSVLHSFIAEELHEVLPEATSYDEKGVPAGVDLGALATVTAAIVQHLLGKVEGLEAKIAEMA